ncbi:MAG: hypothetical protein V4760_08375 [Bdellovibrionota bacterium]
MTRSRTALALLALLTVVGFSDRASAYPDFIGYGYTSCAVCHTNSLGNGPLTDYGRALFSQEIAARPWISESVTDEELAQLSGFIPGVELPYWIRPAIKTRSLWFQTQPGSSASQTRTIPMQRDLSLQLAADEDHRTILTVTYGLLDRPRDYYGHGYRDEMVSREHYARFYLSDQWLVAVGLMDKAYGIRTPDHTAYSRAPLGFGQDDQVHGVLFHRLEEKWDVATHVFAGNLLRTEPTRHKGLSVTGEYEIAEKQRLGGSAAYFTHDTVEYARVGVHDRWALPRTHGSSLMVEVGLKQDKVKATGNAKIGNYMFFESLIRMTRGYNLITTWERYQDEMRLTAVDNQRWTFGVLAFPFQRIETRFTGVQQKSFTPDAAAEDQWSIQGQIHVSL